MRFPAHFLAFPRTFLSRPCRTGNVACVTLVFWALCVCSFRSTRGPLQKTDRFVLGLFRMRIQTLNRVARVLCAFVFQSVLFCLHSPFCVWHSIVCLQLPQRSRSSQEDRQVCVELPFCFKLCFSSSYQVPLRQWMSAYADKYHASSRILTGPCPLIVLLVTA